MQTCKENVQIERERERRFVVEMGFIGRAGRDDQENTKRERENMESTHEFAQ